MVFAPKTLAQRAAPTLNREIGAPMFPGSSLGPSQTLPKALVPPPAHRAAPAFQPPEVPAVHTNSSRTAPPAPRLGPTLPTSVTTREIGYRLRPHVEKMVSAHFVKFDVVKYRVMSVPAPPSAENRHARAVELGASQRMWDHVHNSVSLAASQQQQQQQQAPQAHRPAPSMPHRPAPSTPHRPAPSMSSRYTDANVQVDYFKGLRSQNPQGKSHIYFMKVDAAWWGGFGCLHLRVRTIPPERAPIGIPSAIPTPTEHKLVLEGVLNNLGPDDPLDAFDANMRRNHHAVGDHHDRLRRTNTFF